MLRFYLHKALLSFSGYSPTRYPGGCTDPEGASALCDFSFHCIHALELFSLLGVQAQPKSGAFCDASSSRL